MGSRVGFADRATRILPAVPLHRGPVRFRTLVFRYLAAAFVLLAVVVVLNPSRPDASAPGSAPWDYQHEQVTVEGRGVLNAYARVTVGATAWLGARLGGRLARQQNDVVPRHIASALPTWL